ncbi:uncharacterized protein PG986_011276 [Apiospora aurea]|uniref:Uncharacterized protein n=1 Tax=Apiospora aurea TaxID=335848 RepID=A0ABR1Q4P3_9PEZI
MGTNLAKPQKGSTSSKPKTSKASKAADAAQSVFFAVSAGVQMLMNLHGESATGAWGQPAAWQGLLGLYIQAGSLAACALSVLQGNWALEAQTALQAPPKFAKHVSNFIASMTAQHPDTDWHGEFHKITSETRTSPAYCGMSENLHALCNWMTFIRHCLNNDRRIFPLTIHAHIHNSQETVWLNLPGMRDLESTDLSLEHVGNIAELPPPSFWGGMAWVQNGFQSPEPQPTTVLGADTPVPDNRNHPGQHSPLDRDFHVRSNTNHVSDERRGRRHRRDPGRSKSAHAKRRR